MKKYLFIAGCPRSGTSALVRILSFSKDIVIGMERFGHLVSKKKFQLNKSHFETERFFKLEPNDTFYDDIIKFHWKLYPNMREKYETAKIVGDKRPDLYQSYDELFKNFPEAKVIFIYRQLDEVASSYTARARQQDSWPTNKDYKQAVVDWNESLYLTLKALKKGYNIKVVEYKSIFQSNMSLDDLFEFVEAEKDDKVEQGIIRVRDVAAKLESERKMLLNKNELAFVNKKINNLALDDIQKFLHVNINSSPKC
ncbi:sulfotransferase family protein [Marinomonas shanghaiensis]|uniref:sulfotransferase family protein n=1 Tax=Marinomonas shanghaiensis TaxID=2202418 RepID=UPI003A91EF63